jgi:hypothetical protein
MKYWRAVRLRIYHKLGNLDYCLIDISGDLQVLFYLPSGVERGF